MTQQLIKLLAVKDCELGVVREPSGIIRIGVSGDIVVANRDDLKRLVVEQLDVGERSLVLDLARARYIDAAGMGALVSLSRKAKAAGALLVIEGANEDLRTLFELTKLTEILTIAPTEPAP